MEVDKADEAAGSDENDTSSFELLLNNIKVLEKQSKCMYQLEICQALHAHRLRSTAREQQLANRLEQERLKWQQEKQDLLEQLRKKESPYKVPKRYVRCL